MVEEIYNILKKGKTISCDDIARNMNTSREIVLEILNYLLQMKIIKKQIMSNSAQFTSSGCRGCTKGCNNFKPIYIYSLVDNK
ncbi:MAG TPA: hypothetical protein DG753_09490 [Clostridium sp.]|nr:hypothetical protein [Clostridium sp.]